MLEGAISGALVALIILVPKLIKNKVILWKNLKSSMLFAPDDNQLCFEYKGKLYSYSEFLRLRTIARLKWNESALKKESDKLYSGKIKNTYQEVECCAANAALILKRCNRNYENFAATTTNWIVENRNHIISAPYNAFEALYQTISHPQNSSNKT